MYINLSVALDSNDQKITLRLFLDYNYVKRFDNF